MTAIPAEQIADAHKLSADAEIDLWEVVPAGTSTTLRFKSDNSVTWRGNQYLGVPLTFSGDEKTSQTGSSQPTLTIGQQNVDLSMFKPFVYDGALDGALVRRTHILLADLVANRLIRTQFTYRCKRLPSYSRSQITMSLATYSDSMGFSTPHRQYLPPAFPAINL